MGDKKDTGVVIPADLSTLTDAELSKLATDATKEFDAKSDDENLDAAGLAALSALADNIDRVTAETTTRAETAAELATQRDALRNRVHPPEAGEDGADGDATEVVEGADAPGDPALVASTRGRTRVEDVLNSKNKLNIRLSQAQQAAPKQHNGLGTFGRSVLVASGDIPGYTPGSPYADGMAMVKAFQTRARALSASRALASSPPIMGLYLDGRGDEKFGLLGHRGDWRDVPRFPVAQLQREFRYNLDDTATPEQAWEVMQAAANPEALVAAGGWCSPSEISYDFYNIVAEDGAIVLPTTGIRRGGMRWPTSPSFGDLASSTGLWHWNETQDIAAVTGTGQSGTKTCARVPCAAFNEARLEGEGICITAGNLTTDAWPEQIANFMRLVNATHMHRVNSFFINALIAGSTAVTPTQTALTSATSNILAAVEHQVWDLRTKYAMADTAILEAVFPSWALGIIRADLSRRKGWNSPNDALSISNAEIAAWFTQRWISVQFVQDFDVRGANQFGQSAALTAAWPTTVRFLLYPAGTWVRGNGLSLDLGVIRDSTLNATNDYTAAWSEEFFLLAKIGHESRIVSCTSVVPSGATGADVASAGV